MATVFAMHGGVISIDNAGGTPTVVSGQVQDMEISEERATGVFHTMDTLYSDATRGGIKYTMTMSIYKTTNAAEAYKLLKANLISAIRTITVTADTPDSSTGSERATGEFVFTGFTPSTKRTAGSGDPEVTTAKFVNSGQIVFSTL